MNRADIHDGGYRARSEFAGAVAATAAGSGDATEVNGQWVSRDIANVGMAVSAKLVIGYEAVLAEGKTLTIAANIQDATDSSGTGVADYGTAVAATTVATGDTGGSTERGTIELDFDLAEANEYVRAQFTPDLSASGTDTAKVSAHWVFFGAPKGPMTKSLI